MKRWLKFSGEQKAGESKDYFCKWAEDRKPVVLLFMILLFALFFFLQWACTFYLSPFQAGCWLTAVSVASCGMRSDLVTRPSPLGPGLRGRGNKAGSQLAQARMLGGKNSYHITLLTQHKSQGSQKEGHLHLFSSYWAPGTTLDSFTPILRSGVGSIWQLSKQAQRGWLTCLRSQLGKWQSWDSNPVPHNAKVLGLPCLLVFQYHGLFRLYQKQG